MSDTPLSYAQRSRRTHRLLLDAGRALFAEKGYAHATTTEILQRTGLTHAALSHHFRNKTDFFAAVFVDVRADRVAHLERVIEAADGDLWQRLWQRCPSRQSTASCMWTARPSWRGPRTGSRTPGWTSCGGCARG